MITRISSLAALLCAAVLAQPAAAQIPPEEVVRKIAESIAEEMAEIDRLLLESSRTKDGAEAGEKIRELIGATRQSQGKVIQGIDDLIDELQKMAQQSQNQSSSGSPADQQDQQQGGEPQNRDGQQQQPGGDRQQGNRREIDTPDLQEQPGQNQPGGDQQQPEGDVAESGERSTDPGANRQTGTATEGGAELAERAGDAESWGDLQKYIPPLQRRTGVPEVPAKFRRLHEAFQKRAHKTGKAGGDR